MAILLIVLWQREPTKDTLAYEAAKTCLQVLGLVVLGGVVALATSSVEHSRQDKAARRQAEEANQVAEHQYRQEAFKIRAELLDRTARCAANMYVFCRYVERLREAGGADSGLAPVRHDALLRVPELLDERYLVFSAEGLTVQTEIEARFQACKSPSAQTSAESRETTRSIMMGEASLRWHQVYDLLTVYYFSLTGTFPRDALTNASQSEEIYHSGLNLVEMVGNAAAPTPADLDAVRDAVQAEYRSAMTLLAEALLAEELIAPSPRSSFASA